MRYRLAAVFVAIAANMAPAASSDRGLTEAECAFIEQYDQNNAYSFVSDFVFMAHHSHAINGTEYVQNALTKRSLDISISIMIESQSRNFDAAISAISDFIDIASINTNISTEMLELGDVNLVQGGTFVIYLINENNYSKYADFFWRLGWRNNLIELERIIQPTSNCVGILGEWSSESEVSMAFIDTQHHDRPEQIAQCVREEAYNVMGLLGDPQGDESLFSNPMWRGPATSIEGDFGYGQRDHLMLKLLYRDEFVHGQSIDKTRDDIEYILSKECFDISP
jgi:hypothetical protein